MSLAYIDRGFLLMFSFKRWQTLICLLLLDSELRLLEVLIYASKTLLLVAAIYLCPFFSSVLVVLAFGTAFCFLALCLAFLSLLSF